MPVRENIIQRYKASLSGLAQVLAYRLATRAELSPPSPQATCASGYGAPENRVAARREKECSARLVQRHSLRSADPSRRNERQEPLCGGQHIYFEDLGLESPCLQKQVFPFTMLMEGFFGSDAFFEQLRCAAGWNTFQNQKIPPATHSTATRLFCSGRSKMWSHTADSTFPMSKIVNLALAFAPRKA